MLKVAWEIKQAQEYLKGAYGDEGYRTLIDGAKKKVNSILEKAPDISELEVLAVFVKDEKLPADVRLVALACMGEV